MNEKLNDA